MQTHVFKNTCFFVWICFLFWVWGFFFKHCKDPTHFSTSRFLPKHDHFLHGGAGTLFTPLARGAAHGAGRRREPTFASDRGSAEGAARARPPRPGSRYPHRAGPKRRLPLRGAGRTGHSPRGAAPGMPALLPQGSRRVPGALPGFPGAGPSGSRRSPGSRAPAVSTATASGAAAPTRQRLIGRAALPQAANGSAAHWRRRGGSGAEGARRSRSPGHGSVRKELRAQSPSWDRTPPHPPDHVQSFFKHFQGQ